MLGLGSDVNKPDKPETSDLEEMLTELKLENASLKTQIGRLQEDRDELANQRRPLLLKSRSLDEVSTGKGEKLDQIQLLKNTIEEREQEINRLEKELNDFRQDLEHVRDNFGAREIEMKRDVENMTNKCALLSNLLQLANERTGNLEAQTNGTDSGSIKKQLLQRIECLERLLAHERLKKKYVDAEKSSASDGADAKGAECDLLKKEV